MKKSRINNVALITKGAFAKQIKMTVAEKVKNLELRVATLEGENKFLRECNKELMNRIPNYNINPIPFNPPYPYRPLGPGEVIC